MKLESIHNVYFVGIGGIGMSALARYFVSIGKAVAGYDRVQKPLTDQLTSEGMDIHYVDSVNEIPEKYRNLENTLIVFTPAIPDSHTELNYFKDNKFEILKRSQVLGLLSKSNKTLAVAGTHGKTTISTMISHILHTSSVGCNAFLGGISKNYDSNLITNENSNLMVVEADEFDRSFMQLYPEMAVISAVDADHLDIYGDKNELHKTFKDFAGQINSEGCLVVKESVELDFNIEGRVYKYSLDQECDFYAKSIENRDGYYFIDLVNPFGLIENLKINSPGLLNVENSIAASAIALLNGVSEDELRKSLSSFDGIQRRFDYQIRTKDLVYIDDYAHHPEELQATINSVKALYPKKKITGVFQPHLFSRTNDFYKDFAKSLDLLDEIILLDIYPAREEPMPGVTSEIIFKEITNQNKRLIVKKELVQEIESGSFEVLLTLGAGDIDDFVEPIREMLKERIK